MAPASRNDSNMSNKGSEKRRGYAGWAVRR
jgi:hypothetical protein